MMHQLELRCRRPGLEHRSPATGRWGTPPAIAELRLRRLMDGELTAGGLEVTASTAAHSIASGPLDIELAIARDGPRPAAIDAELLVSWASSASGGWGGAVLELAADPPSGPGPP